MPVHRAVDEELDVLLDGFIYEGNPLAFFIVVPCVYGLYALAAYTSL